MVYNENDDEYSKLQDAYSWENWVKPVPWKYQIWVYIDSLSAFTCISTYCDIIFCGVLCIAHNPKGFRKGFEVLSVFFDFLNTLPSQWIRIKYCHTKYLHRSSGFVISHESINLHLQFYLRNPLTQFTNRILLVL
jgi:hypothetical protein